MRLSKEADLSEKEEAMWRGVIPAVTTKFNEDFSLDHAEMERCFALQMDAGCHGLIACGTLGEGNMLSHEERIDVLRLCKSATGDKPALLTISEAGTREACDLAKIGYRVDITPEMMVELAEEPLFVAIKESSDDIRRATEIFNMLGDRYDVLTGVDNLAYEALAVGAVGWVAGLVVAFPRETVAIYELMQQNRHAEALKIYRWFRPLLDLDVSTYLVQQIKLAELIEINSNDRVRMPRQPLKGDHRARVERIIRDAIACRPDLPQY